MSKKYKKIDFVKIIYLLSIFLLLIIALNILVLIPKYERGTKVLGAEIKNVEGIFWYEFLKKHPNYIPGWIEIGRTDKAKKIDPNYE